MDRNELIRQFLIFFPRGTPDILSDQDLANYIRAATEQMQVPNTPFYGTSQGRIQAGMGPILPGMMGPQMQAPPTLSSIMTPNPESRAPVAQMPAYARQAPMMERDQRMGPMQPAQAGIARMGQSGLYPNQPESYGSAVNPNGLSSILRRSGYWR